MHWRKTLHIRLRISLVKNIVGNKWALTLKNKVDSFIERYKVRLIYT